MILIRSSAVTLIKRPPIRRHTVREQVCPETGKAGIKVNPKWRTPFPSIPEVRQHRTRLTTNGERHPRPGHVPSDSGTDRNYGPRGRTLDLCGSVGLTVTAELHDQRHRALRRCPAPSGSVEGLAVGSHFHGGVAPKTPTQTSTTKTTGSSNHCPFSPR